MRKLSLNVKLGFILALFVVACGIISYSGISSIGKMNDSIKTILVRDQRIQNILNIRGLLLSMIIQEKLVLNAESQSDRDISIRTIDTLEKESITIIDDWLQIATDFAKPRLDQIKTIFNSWRDTDKMVQQLAQKGELKQATVLSFSKGKEQRQAMEKILDELLDYNKKEMNGAKTSAEETAIRSRNTMIAVSAISIFLGLLLSVVILRALSLAIDRVIRNLTDSSNQLTSAAHQVASSSEELSQAASEQAASLQQTSASIQQMSSMVSKNSENAQQTSTTSVQSQQNVIKGKGAVQEVIQAIEEISTSNSAIMAQTDMTNTQLTEIVKVITEIGSKTKVINDIVFQTKLLSFNASVEAARAGEHGKGFAVVAEEVGNLAQMSGNAAKEISTMLESSIRKVETIVTETKSKVEHLIADGKEKVNKGTEIARQCGTVLDEIVGGVSRVASMAEEISTASHEQAQGVQEITKAMGQLDQVTQQNSAASEEAASAAEELSAQAQSLQGIVRALVETVKGGDSHAEQVMPSASTSSLGKETRTLAQVVPLAKKLQPAASGETLKKVAGHDVTPSFEDHRFKDV